MERRVEAALERFTLERVAEELERTVDVLMVRAVLLMPETEYRPLLLAVLLL